MFIFNQEIIEYEYINTHSKNTVLFLHGWGGDKNSFQTLKNQLKKSFNVLSITLPTVSPTTEIWTLFDYVCLVFNLLKLHNIENVIVVCHSFGFRVACVLQNFIKIKKIVVTGGAGPKKENLFLKLEKQQTQISLKLNPNNFKKFASKDYFALSPTNRQTFKNIVNQNLIKTLAFTCPMLIFWGKFDRDTKPWIAKKLKRKNNAKLVLTNSDHFAYIKETNLFVFEVKKFLL